MRIHSRHVLAVAATLLAVAVGAGLADIHYLAAADPCHQGSVVYCVLNPAVTASSVATTICRPGWTATVRPPTTYTDRLKQQQLATQHLPGGPAAYEEDHRMPLELGGDPKAPQNLSPEAHPGSSAKDTAENAAKVQVCRGGDLRTVQRQFAATWLAPYPGYRR